MQIQYNCCNPWKVDLEIKKFSFSTKKNFITLNCITAINSTKSWLELIIKMYAWDNP
jgi:hypothetical protein